nr:hypothetical protein [Tanacetum cinerariifolium]
LLGLTSPFGLLAITGKTNVYHVERRMLRVKTSSWARGHIHRYFSPFEELSDIGSPRADDHGHLKLPEMLEDPYVEVALQAPPSPDYIPGLEEPEQAPPSPDYVPGPEHADDEIDPEEDRVDYPADGGDDGDDKEGSSEDDDMDIEADEEEEEEHPAPTDPVVVASTAADQAPSVEETEPFETDESAA